LIFSVAVFRNGELRSAVRARALTITSGAYVV
jgi:hypothetical protein